MDNLDRIIEQLSPVMSVQYIRSKIEQYYIEIMSLLRYLDRPQGFPVKINLKEDEKHIQQIFKPVTIHTRQQSEAFSSSQSSERCSAPSELNYYEIEKDICDQAYQIVYFLPRISRLQLKTTLGEVFYQCGADYHDSISEQIDQILDIYPFFNKIQYNNLAQQSSNYITICWEPTNHVSTRLNTKIEICYLLKSDETNKYFSLLTNKKVQRLEIQMLKNVFIRNNNYQQLRYIFNLLDVSCQTKSRQKITLYKEQMQRGGNFYYNFNRFSLVNGSSRLVYATDKQILMFHNYLCCSDNCMVPATDVAGAECDGAQFCQSALSDSSISSDDIYMFVEQQRGTAGYRSQVQRFYNLNRRPNKNQQNALLLQSRINCIINNIRQNFNYYDAVYPRDIDLLFFKNFATYLSEKITMHMAGIKHDHLSAQKYDFMNQQFDNHTDYTLNSVMDYQVLAQKILLHKPHQNVVYVSTVGYILHQHDSFINVDAAVMEQNQQEVQCLYQAKNSNNAQLKAKEALALAVDDIPSVVTMRMAEQTKPWAKTQLSLTGFAVHNRGTQ